MNPTHIHSETQEKVTAMAVTKPSLVPNLRYGNMRANKGDYVVVNANGYATTIGKREFESTYERLASE